MTILTLIIAIIALVIAILAYQRAGGIEELKRQIEAGSLREKTADLLARIEKKLRKEESIENSEEKQEKDI